MKAAITGSALRTPLGGSIEGVAAAILRGERAAAATHRFPLDTYPCSLVAPVSGEPGPSRHRRFLRRIALFAAEAAAEAFARSGLGGTLGRGERFGVFSAMGGLRADWDELMPALADQRADGEGAWERGFRGLHPFWMLRYLSNNVHAVVSAALGARGDGVALGGPTAGAQAIGSALRALECGAIDAALVVAYDSLIEPETLIEMGARGEASRAGEGSLEAPYSVGAAGFVPGEGAAAVVLERADSAGGRANSFVDVAGSADGGRGEPAKATIARVVGRVVRPGDDVIDGAARALPELDALEREAAAAFVAEGASLVAIGASLGRTGAPAALLQAILLTHWLSNGALPPIAGLREGALAKGPLNPLTEGRATSARSAIGISTGASGAAAAIRVQLP